VAELSATLAASFPGKQFHLAWAWSKGGFSMAEFFAKFFSFMLLLLQHFPMSIFILHGMEQRRILYGRVFCYIL